MKRLRLRVSHQDAALVLAQGATSRSYKPFAHAFGVNAKRNASLIVTAVNCHRHMVTTLQHIERASRMNGSDARTRVRLIGRFARTALARIES